MAQNIDFFDTYYLAGMAEEIVPDTTFFRDRYFGETDEFATDKILVEFMDGDRKMAPFVDPRAGDIAVDRGGYELHEFEPPMIAPSRLLTLDDLKKRGFGEALYANSTPADRARALQIRDLTDLTKRIVRREEWMAAQTMINNGVTVQEYIDAQTTGRSLPIYFYDTNGSNPGIYTGSTWTTWALMQADVLAMCDSLSESGLPAADLVLGSTAWAAIKQFSDLQNLLDKRHEFIGELEARIAYPGVSHVGQLDFDGYMLNIFVARERYVADNGTKTSFFPANGAMVTAPGCGKRYYGAVTQIPYGSDEPETFTGQRIPKLVVDQDKDTRKLRLASRPLTAPKNKAPWRYFGNCVN